MLKWKRERKTSASWYRISVGNDEELREFDGLWLHNIMNVLNVTDSLDSWNAKCYNTYMYVCMHVHIYVHLCSYVCHNKNNSAIRRGLVGRMDGLAPLHLFMDRHSWEHLRCGQHIVRFLCVLQRHWDQSDLQLRNPVVSVSWVLELTVCASVAS